MIPNSGSPLSDTRPAVSSAYAVASVPGRAKVPRQERDLAGPDARPAHHRHYVEIPPTGALTVIVTSRVVRNWGFWVKGKFKRPLRFFGKFGHPPCSEQ